MTADIGRKDGAPELRPRIRVAYLLLLLAFIGILVRLIVLHGSGVEIAGIPFYGIGGGIPVTPFGSWSFDFSEVDAEALLQGCPAGAVLVSHSPPKGTVDADSSGRHLGSTAVRDAIVRTHARLVVCGHIHSSAGQHALIGSTPVVNAGPAGMIWTL